MCRRAALSVSFLVLVACGHETPETIEKRLSDQVGTILIGDTKETALSRLASLGMACKESPITPARAGAQPDERFSQVTCYRKKPHGSGPYCYQSVQLLVFNGRINYITSQTAGLGGAPAEWTCRGR